ncbi:MAG: 50S ribosomal protein L23 [Patescibacteria group bacterium]
MIKPIITEKATNLGADRKYIFEVATGANRIEIAKAVESLYGVQPLKVNIIRQGGKQIRYGRAEGRTKDRKKAIVTLREGESIKIQDGV